MNFFSQDGEKYQINKNTMMIMPSKSSDGGVTVLESDREILLEENALELINNACMEYGANLEGLQMLMKQIAGMEERIPIPIDHMENIYAFPTESPYHEDCCWIFLDHVGKIIGNKYNRKQSVILFKNNLTVMVNVEPYIMKRQLHRASICKLVFSKWMDDVGVAGGVFISYE